MTALRILLPAAIVAGLMAAGCSDSDDKLALDVSDEELAASVEDWELSKAQLEEFLQRLPEAQRRRFSSPEGRAELALRLMQEEMSFREAKRLKLAEKENARKQIEEAKRTILVAEYLREYVDAKALPTDEETHEYYETHPDQFTTQATIRAQHVFSKSKDKLVDIKKRVEEGGEKFTTMAHLYSEDSLTKPDGGDLGYFNPGGYIRGVGYSKAFSEAVESMEQGKIYGPVQWEQGWSLVRVNEHQPATLRPYDEVKDEIANRLSREKIEETRAAHFEEVKQKYKTRNYMQESYERMQRGPEELFLFAQNSEDPHQRINAFQEIVDKFPNDPYAPQAMFMIGFVYAEELRDYLSADRAFGDLIRKYPDSEMADTAKWMLENLDKPLPKFEDLDDLNRKISDQTN